MTDTKHTDSVEARFNAKFNTHPYDKAQHIEYKAKEIIRFIKSEIKKSNSQQVEEAVRIDENTSDGYQAELNQLQS